MGVGQPWKDKGRLNEELERAKRMVEKKRRTEKNEVRQERKREQTSMRRHRREVKKRARTESCRSGHQLVNVQK